MIKHSRTTRKKSNALDVVQSFINQRQRISESKIDENPSDTSEPAQKKIRVEPRYDELYELPFEDKFEIYTKEGQKKQEQEEEGCSNGQPG